MAIERGMIMRKGNAPELGVDLEEMQSEAIAFDVDSTKATPRIRQNFVETWLWSDLVVG